MKCKDKTEWSQFHIDFKRLVAQIVFVVIGSFDAIVSRNNETQRTKRWSTKIDKRELRIDDNQKRVRVSNLDDTH